MSSRHNNISMIAVDVFNVVLSIFLSVLFTSFFIPQILIVSFRKRLFDYADERKVHTGVVPRLGGVAFVPSIIVTVAFVIGLKGDGKFKNPEAASNKRSGRSIPFSKKSNTSPCFYPFSHTSPLHKYTDKFLSINFYLLHQNS